CSSDLGLLHRFMHSVDKIPVQLLDTGQAMLAKEALNLRILFHPSEVGLIATNVNELRTVEYFRYFFKQDLHYRVQILVSHVDSSSVQLVIAKRKVIRHLLQKLPGMARNLQFGNKFHSPVICKSNQINEFIPVIHPAFSRK